MWWAALAVACRWQPGMKITALLDALNSGKYDLEHTALLITQTGGGCRASNYIGFISRALEKADMMQIPVISINLAVWKKIRAFRLHRILLFVSAMQRSSVIS